MELFDNNFQVSGASMPSLGGDPNTVTFSGLSGGAYMSHLMHVVHP